MKYPLAKSEWGWLILAVIMIIVMTGGFGLIAAWIFKDDTFILLSAVLGLLFIWGKIVIPFMDRI